VIYRGVPGVNVFTPFGHGIAQPDAVSHAWRGGSVSLGSHDSVQQAEGFRPSVSTEGGQVICPRLWVKIQCPSWSHREKRINNKIAPGLVRRETSPITEVSESVSSAPMPMMPLPEAVAAAPMVDREIGRKPGLPIRSAGVPSVPVISDNERIDHKVVCSVLSGHTHHGVRFGQRERSSSVL